MTSTFPSRADIRPIPDSSCVSPQTIGFPTAVAECPADSAVQREGLPALILPFRQRVQRQPSDRDLEQAVAHAVNLLTSGHVDEAERRFNDLAEIARKWRLAERGADWQLPAWLGGVVCHALRCEWLAAEMAACEHLSEMPTEELASVYIDAIALGNQWLADVPAAQRAVEAHVGPVERRRFPRTADPVPDRDSDPARDYSYALISALRFRLGD
ncbi:MAG TPA: hypothetical protein VGT61_01330 [Thermomicrobiales bacterium]|jgi:hypothetical protein|nr:hypothetical protein [Thermomicrobiales bacterium]